MNINRKKNDVETVLTDDWQDYDRCRDYLAGKGFYGTVDKAYRFYMGDQWGSDAPKDMPKPQINVIRRQVDYKVATIMGNGMSLNFSNAEFKDRRLADFTEKIAAPLNNYIAKEWERNSMDDRLWLCSQEACISGAVGIYSYFDDKEEQIACELKSNTEVLFADEQEKDIQKQEFIILPFRRPVREIRKLAKENGVDEFLIRSVVADYETEKEVGDYAKTEIDAGGEDDGKCLCLLKLYKDKDGKVCMRKSTRTVVYQPEVCTELTLYPIAWMTWNQIKGSARGKGDVVEWIPNQVEINKNEAKRAIAVMMGAYPKLAYLTQKIQNPESLTEYGTAIGVEGMDITDVTKAVGYLNATQMSPDAKLFVDELINRTQEMSGASQFVLGNIDPAQTSGRAILAIKDASAVTLSMQQSKLKHFVEDIGRIWWDIWTAYSPNGKYIVHDDTEKRPVIENGQPKIGMDGKPMTEETAVQIVEVIPPDVLKQIKFSVKVDVSPSNVFSKYAVEQTLENMLARQIITFEEYVEALPEDSIAPKSKLSKIVEDRVVLKKLQAERDQAIMERDQAAASYSQLANLMPILEQKGKEYLAKHGSYAKATDKSGAAT